MNVILWILAGGVAGWVGCSAFHLNAARGLVVSSIIGVIGAYFGGNFLAPIIHGTTGNPGDFSPIALLIAFVSAIGSLAIGDMMYEHFGL